MDWIHYVFNEIKRPGEIRIGDRYYKKHGGVYWVESESGLEDRHFGFYVPIEEEFWEIRDILPLVFLYKQAINEAPKIKDNILNENIPLKMELIKRGTLGFRGGRIYDAALLGMIKYSPAIPELKEAMQHDLNYEMRAECAESLGNMGKMAWDCVPPLCESLLKDKDLAVSREAARALGKIGNPVAAVPLRDAFEEARIRLHPFTRMRDYHYYSSEINDACFLLEDSLMSLIKLNPQSGREALAEALGDDNPHVFNSAKKAALFSGHYKMIENREEPKIVLIE